MFCELLLKARPQPFLLTIIDFRDHPIPVNQEAEWDHKCCIAFFGNNETRIGQYRIADRMRTDESHSSIRSPVCRDAENDKLFQGRLAAQPDQRFHFFLAVRCPRRPEIE